MAWLPDGENKRLRICLALLTRYRRVTDRRTDGRTDRRANILQRHSLVHAMHSIARQKRRGDRSTLCVVDVFVCSSEQQSYCAVKQPGTRR